MPVVCINRPNRTRARIFTARDVGRICAYARQDGANDAELIAQLLKAFGRKELGCQLFRILDILNTAFFLGAIISLLKGIITVIKGLKIVITGKKSRILGSFLEILTPDRFKNHLAAFLLWTGGVEIGLSGLVLFITGIANNVAIYLLAKGICETDTQNFGIEVDPIDIGDLPDVLDMTWSELFKFLNEDKQNG